VSKVELENALELVTTLHQAATEQEVLEIAISRGLLDVMPMAVFAYLKQPHTDDLDLSMAFVNGHVQPAPEPHVRALTHDLALQTVKQNRPIVHSALKSDSFLTSLAAAPMSMNSQTVGALIIGHSQPGFFTARNMQILDLLSRHVAFTICALREHGHLLGLRRRYDALLEATEAVHDPGTVTSQDQSDRMTDTLNEMCERACKAFRSEAAAIWLPKRGSPDVEWRIAGLFGFSTKITEPRILAHLALHDIRRDGSYSPRRLSPDDLVSHPLSRRILVRSCLRVPFPLDSVPPRGMLEIYDFNHHERCDELDLPLLRLLASQIDARLDRMFRDLMHSYAFDGIIVSDVDGSIRECNKRAAEILECTREELMLKNARDIYLEPAYARAVREELQKHHGSIRGHETVVKSGSGKSITVWLSARDLCEGGIAGFFTDFPAKLNCLEQIAAAATTRTKPADFLNKVAEALVRAARYQLVDIPLLTGDYLEPRHRAVDQSESNVLRTGGTKFPTLRIGQGICGHVVKTRKPHYAENVAVDKYYVMSHDLTRSEYCVPLIVTDRVIGVLDVQSSTEGFFTDEDRRFISMIARMVAGLLELLTLHRTADEAAMTVLAELDREAVFDAILAQARNISSVRADVANYHSYDPPYLRTERTHPGEVNAQDRVRNVNDRWGVTGRAVLQKRWILEDDVWKLTEDDYIPEHPNTRSELAVPVFDGVDEDNVIGVI
jgi:PAS domain S-box-containing protein